MSLSTMFKMATRSIMRQDKQQKQKLVAAIRIFMNIMKKLCKTYIQRNIAYTL